MKRLTLIELKYDFVSGYERVYYTVLGYRFFTSLMVTVRRFTFNDPYVFTSFP